MTFTFKEFVLDCNVTQVGFTQETELETGHSVSRLPRDLSASSKDYSIRRKATTVRSLAAAPRQIPETANPNVLNCQIPTTHSRLLPHKHSSLRLFRVVFSARFVSAETLNRG